MTFWQEFALVFSEMGVLPAICIIVGLGLVITEMFIPGFGFPGISGTILLIAGIVIRVINAGKGNPVIQFFVLLILILVILAIAFIIMLESMKKGWLSKTSIVEKSTAVSTGHTAGTLDFNDLVGKVGITVTPLRPTGMVSIEGKNYDATAVSTFLDKDVMIEVESVEGVKINVRVKENGDNMGAVEVTSNSNVAEAGESATSHNDALVGDDNGAAVNASESSEDASLESTSLDVDASADEADSTDNK